MDLIPTISGGKGETNDFWGTKKRRPKFEQPGVQGRIAHTTAHILNTNRYRCKNLCDVALDYGNLPPVKAIVVCWIRYLAGQRKK